jgi:TetR/AcrR family transcriptional regulator, cholesterol catabolism regulator
VAEPFTPAVPSTPAQRERYSRVLAAASAILSSGGAEALQMRDLAQRAGVSIATLYRYFPAKDHVLLALALGNYEAALKQVRGEAPVGATPRERVTNHLLREFRAQQRNLTLSAALSNVLRQDGAAYVEVMEAIAHIHQQILSHVAGAGGPVSEHQRRMMPIIIDNFSAAARRYRSGLSSAAEARFQIRTGCHLLDLSDSTVADELERSAMSLARPDGSVSGVYANSART